jgi:hypothetical protein
MRARNRNSLLLVLIALSVFTASRSRAESPQTIELQERLGRKWEQEALTYEVSFPPGACRPDSVRFQLGTLSIPCQLSDVQYWPDGKSVKEACRPKNESCTGLKWLTSPTRWPIPIAGPSRGAIDRGIPT